MPSKKKSGIAPSTNSSVLDNTVMNIEDSYKLQFAKQFRSSNMKLIHLKKYVNNLDISVVSIEDLDSRVEKTSELHNDYTDLIDLLMEIDETDEDYNKYSSEIEEFINAVMSVKSKLSAAIKVKHPPQTNVDTKPSNVALPSRPKPKLPHMPIPSFSGNPGEWIPFKNTFTALVHNDPDLSGVVKFSYLLDRLNSETKSFLGTITLSDEGYDKAWEALLECFDNKRKIVDHHIDALLSLSSVPKDNPKELRKLINTCVSNVTSLELCNQRVDGLGEQLLINIVIKKIEVSLRKEWEAEISSNQLPNWNQLIEFLKKKCRVLESVDIPTKHPLQHSFNQQASKVSNNQVMKFRPRSKPNNSQVMLNTTSSIPSTKPKSTATGEQCQFCNNGNHHLYKCYKFLVLSAQDRKDKIKTLNVCANCLRTANHDVKACSYSRCRICNQTHHTLLHPQQTSNRTNATCSTQAVASTSNAEPHDATHTFYIQNKSVQTQVLLPTAIIKIQNRSGNYVDCRALLDSGSQINLITSTFAKRLGLPLKRCEINSISGIDQLQTSITEELSTNIKSNWHNFNQNITCSVVSSIANRVPKYNFDISPWNIPKYIALADPQFGVQRPIDVLIGSDLFFKTLRPKQISIGSNRPIFQDTLFGWIATGKLQDELLNFAIHDTDYNHNQDNLHDTLKRMFDLDPVANANHLSREEQKCEEHYANTTYRDDSGRYVVSLPLTEEVNSLGDSKAQALRRFLHLERKLDANPEFKKQYSDVIDDYKILHHMSLVNDSDDSMDQSSFYLPHHAVIKPSSSTTKVRIVFDASAKSSSGLSLNDVMRTGPTVQQPCFNITLRFRKYRYVFTCDVTKMYRQIKIDPSQTHLQRILWRSNKNDSIKTYELNRVTFGTASAPYLATRTVNQLAVDEQRNFPAASQISLRDFYVDDCLSGANDLTSAIESVRQLREMFSTAGFNLCKWSTNNASILHDIPSQDWETLKSNEVSSIECIKALGIAWQPNEDKFILQIPKIENMQYVTKRSILSQLATLYDPLGLMSPVLISAKILLQKMWKNKSDWDDNPSQEILEFWNKFQSTLPVLRDIKIDRMIVCDQPVSIQLHGFSDASETAYGSCIYIRSVDMNNYINVRLVCSKSRVAPIKNVSLPRLELCAALLLAQLTSTVISALEIDFEKVCLWSDSSITLSWIGTEPYKLKTFVANRVSEIQDLTKNYTWRHISTVENPADIISRGIMPNELSSSPMWFNGPPILYTPLEFNTSSTEDTNFDPTIFELKSEYISLVSTNNDDSDEEDETKTIVIHDSENLINKYSSYTKLLRAAAYCIRFRKNCKFRKKLKHKTGFLTTDEINDALEHIVRFVQRESFKEEIKCLKKKRQLPSKSSILSLSPFLDKRGILRVGGRLSQSNLHYDSQHQMLLPSKHNFTTLIFRHFHTINCHAGPQLLLSIVRQKFWPISGKIVAKKCVRFCVTCFRNKPLMSQQIMGQLPKERVTPARPFATTGIDYCGPFLIKDKRQRKSPPYKVYLSLFVCFVTKCMHIEIVSDLTSEAFLACLKRFIYRRGTPATIWSDNAMTFIGAKNEMHELFQFFQNQYNQDAITKFCTLRQVDWKFIPPRSPNFGGIWESCVKSVKTHLKRVTMNQILSYEELNTVVIQIEGILNSRPLTDLPSDPSDPQPLTPSHFLCGSAILAPAEPSLTEIPSNRLSKWQQVNQIVQSYWKRFSIEYLHSLQQKSKWKQQKDNLKENDIVLIVDEQLPSTHWLLGIIIEVTKGPDGKIRVVKVKTKNGTFSRAVSKICKLPFEN